MVRGQAVHLDKRTDCLTSYRWQIAKVPLCLLVAVSALFGFFLASPRYFPQAPIVFSGVLLLACGGASLNSYQEYRLDRLLARTRNRPLARGLITPGAALLQARILLLLGLSILYLGSTGQGPFWIGALSIVLYNFVYTPLKYRSIWALVPGALCGALPPLIGWLAGGGGIASPVILTLVVLFAVWQMPHFWLVVLDNREDYQRGVLPSMIKLMPERSLRLLSAVWVTALVTIMHLLIIQLNHLPAISRWSVSISGLLMGIYFAMKMCVRTRPDYRLLFMLLNGFMFLLMILLSLGSISGR